MPTGIYKREKVFSKNYIPKIVQVLEFRLSQKEKEEIMIWYRKLSYHDRQWVRELADEILLDK